MKHLISVSALVLSMAACSSDPGPGGGASGSGNTTAGASATGGKSSAGGGSAVAGSPSTGGGGAGTAGGGNTAGAAPTAGAPAAGGTAGTSAGGAGAGAGGGMSAAGSTSAGGAGPAATFKCDNLSLAPSMAGVAKPAGAAGGLKVLDWAGFKGAASFTFDDNTPSQLQNYAALKATGGHFTWFLIASSAAADYKMTIADGQEIANHTQTHPQGASAGEVTNAQSTLKTKFGVDVHSMADLDDVATAFRLKHERKMRLATKYVNLTRNFFSAHGITDYRIVESAGATEGAPAAGTAELIVDITTTGTTAMCMSRCRPAPTAIGIATSRCGMRIHMCRTRTIRIDTD